MGFEQTIRQEAIGNVAALCAAPVRKVDRAAIERIAKELIIERRKRSAYFPAELFADPAWDILLSLTLAEARCRRLSVSQVCDRVAAPATTALRWVHALTEQGFLVRRDDATDKRRKYIELSPEASTRMVDYCATVGTARPLAA